MYSSRSLIILSYSIPLLYNIHYYISYFGSTANTFKERYGNHSLSFKHEKYQNNTSLSKYIWNLKSQGIPYNITWETVGKAPSYSPISNICHLCLLEKLIILTNEDAQSLNQRTELMAKCRHRLKYLLSDVRWYCRSTSLFF